LTADRPFYSGKHRKHGMNLQVIASPAGEILWVSGALPGAVHDLTAARIWGIVRELAAAGLITLADKGYIGAGDPVHTPYRGRNKPASQKDANRAHAKLRAPGERANAQLKTWQILLTKPYSPTTIGKVERWHQTLQTDFLNDAGPFATIEDAQAAVDGWRHEYNHDRPHQSLSMATPASVFRPAPPQEGEALSLPAGRAAGPAAPRRPADARPEPRRGALAHPTPIPPGERHRLQGARLAGAAPLPEATVTIQRRVSSRGGIQVARQRIHVGMTHAGKIVTVIPETNTFRLVLDGDTVAVVPRTTSHEIGRYKAHATHPRRR
jgi:DDE superfamily endonuclease